MYSGTLKRLPFWTSLGISMEELQSERESRFGLWRKLREREKWDQMGRPSHNHERREVMLCNILWVGGGGLVVAAESSFPLGPPWPLNPSWLKWVADVEAPLCVQTEGALCFIGFHWMTERRDKDWERDSLKHTWLLTIQTCYKYKCRCLKLEHFCSVVADQAKV